MVLEGAAVYGGLSDSIEVLSWLEDNDGNEIHDQLDTLLVELMHADVVMVDERNFNSFSAMEALGVTWYKRHRSYWRQI